MKHIISNKTIRTARVTPMLAPTAALTVDLFDELGASVTGGAGGGGGGGEEVNGGGGPDTGV